jgi:hypothetical protein
MLVLCAIFLAAFSAPAEREQSNQAAQQATPATSPTPEQPKPKLQRVHVDLSGFELDKTAPSGSTTQIGGATRSIGGSTTLLAPHFCRVFAAHPVFHWSHSSQAQSFEFSLLDDKQNVVYRAHVSGRELRYPDDAPPLEPGAMYGWNVKPEAALLGGASATYRFSRLPQAELDQIAKQLQQIGSDESKRLERAQLFTDRRLWFDTVQELSDAIRAHPQQADLFERRGTIYDQIPATRTLAEEDFAIADKLRGSQNP